MPRLSSACSLAALLGVGPLAFALDTSELVQVISSVRTSGRSGGSADTVADKKKCSDLVDLKVRPIFGPEFSVSACSRKPLQDLTPSIASKLKLPAEAMTYKRNGRPLDKLKTPATLRIQKGYVIEVSSRALWAKKLETEGNATKAAREQQQIVGEARAKTAAEEKRRREDAAATARREEQEKKDTRAANGEVSLRFTSSTGGEDVVLTAKKDAPLGSRFKLVLKRMGMDQAHFLLRQRKGPVRGLLPDDTAEQLYIKDGATILVKPK